MTDGIKMSAENKVLREMLARAQNDLVSTSTIVKVMEETFANRLRQAEQLISRYEAALLSVRGKCSTGPLEGDAGQSSAFRNEILSEIEAALGSVVK